MDGVQGNKHISLSATNAGNTSCSATSIAGTPSAGVWSTGLVYPLSGGQILLDNPGVYYPSAGHTYVTCRVATGERVFTVDYDD
jgi:hypothetical protein